MAKTKPIPKEVKEEVLNIVDAFNEKYRSRFFMTFRGRFAYLAKTDQQIIEIPFSFIERLVIKLGIPMEHRRIEYPVLETKLGRLEYHGKMDNWSFAVFKYSREIYDKDEWMFPGQEELDGTIEGGLRAGMVIYD